MLARQSLVEGAADAEGAAVDDVGVDHGGADIAVAQERRAAWRARCSTFWV